MADASCSQSISSSYAFALLLVAVATAAAMVPEEEGEHAQVHLPDAVRTWLASLEFSAGASRKMRTFLWSVITQIGMKSWQKRLV